jgi:putative ABC transport system permease protein
MIDIIKIAARNLMRYKRRTLLTSLLITVGLVAVLLFISIAGSFKNMMVDQFTDSMVGHIQVHRRGYVGAMESLPVDRNMRPPMLVKLYDVLDKTDEIAAWSPRIKFMAMYSNFANTTSIRLNGVYPEREISTVPLVLNRVLEGGEKAPFVKRGYIQVPELIANGMKTKVGDTIVLVATNKEGSVNGKSFIVQGILESISGPGGRDGYLHIEDARDLLRIVDEGVDQSVLAGHGYAEPEKELDKETLKQMDSLKAPAKQEVNAADAKQLAAANRLKFITQSQALFKDKGWGRSSEVSEIAIRLKNRGTLDDTLAKLEAQVADLKNKKNMTIFQIHPWEKFVPFSKIANMIDLMNLFIKIILISVVLISIMNVLIMAVYERIREIGTMSAIGTRPQTILMMFISEGFLLGVLGTLIGTTVSLVAVYILNQVTITFAFGRQDNLVLVPTLAASDVILTVVLTIIVAALASLQPAWKASRMDPIKALRHL